MKKYCIFWILYEKYILDRINKMQIILTIVIILVVLVFTTLWRFISLFCFCKTLLIYKIVVKYSCTNLILVAHSLGSSPNLSTSVISIYFILDIVARAVMSKGIGNIIDIFNIKKISKGMWPVMKNVFMAVIALCVAFRECGVTG